MNGTGHKARSGAARKRAASPCACPLTDAAPSISPARPQPLRQPAIRRGPVLMLLASTVLAPGLVFAQTPYSGSSTTRPAAYSTTSNGSSGYGTAATSGSSPTGPLGSGNGISPVAGNPIPTGSADPYGDPYAQETTGDDPNQPLNGRQTAGQEGLADETGEAAELDLNQPVEGPLNPPELNRDGIDNPLPRTDDGLGVRLGTFTLRPSVNQSINHETERTGAGKASRNYLSTAIRGTLSSDWSRHALTVTGEGTFEKTLSGRTSNSADFEPEGRIDADLRLDLSNDTIANITGNYALERESNSDPNAVAGASTQSTVQRFGGGASIERDFGVMRGTAAVSVARSVYGDVDLSDGTSVSRGDRDRTGFDGRLRVGYELSPAIIPFLEVAAGRAVYDERFDSSGYRRSSNNYAVRSGVEFDFSEKLRGELGVGYIVAKYDDNRLDELGAVAFDGNATWSPRRGTDIDFGLRTTLQDATAAGANGWAEYRFSTALQHQMRSDLIARLTGATTLRDFPSGSNESTYELGAGITYRLNRYLDLTGDVTYEHEENAGGSPTKTVQIGAGLTLRR
ncbi:outer membrane beta-barrel protein [Endobacterium cereale]|uniref:outer membrane beta-barrel protein n=1 Tax=Endobacterium cereale TaxID=2663029 RepID=UPI002B45E625|nr:outer membrane beta-barrel protein [Endobacterium cereale]MEB2845665.1 outer membrane beta-barrel protein [Endobacterium cereale]